MIHVLVAQPRDEKADAAKAAVRSLTPGTFYETLPKNSVSQKVSGLKRKRDVVETPGIFSGE
jgi:hypothetical protein